MYLDLPTLSVLGDYEPVLARSISAPWWKTHRLYESLTVTEKSRSVYEHVDRFASLLQYNLTQALAQYSEYHRFVVQGLPVRTPGQWSAPNDNNVNSVLKLKFTVLHFNDVSAMHTRAHADTLPDQSPTHVLHDVLFERISVMVCAAIFSLLSQRVFLVHFPPLRVDAAVRGHPQSYSLTSLFDQPFIDVDLATSKLADISALLTHSHWFGDENVFQCTHYNSFFHDNVVHLHYTHTHAREPSNTHTHTHFLQNMLRNPHYADLLHAWTTRYSLFRVLMHRLFRPSARVGQQLASALPMLAGKQTINVALHAVRHHPVYNLSDVALYTHVQSLYARIYHYMQMKHNSNLIRVWIATDDDALLQVLQLDFEQQFGRDQRVVFHSVDDFGGVLSSLERSLFETYMLGHMGEYVACVRVACGYMCFCRSFFALSRIDCWSPAGI